MIKKWSDFGGYMQVDPEHIIGRCADVELMKTKLVKFKSGKTGKKEPGIYAMDGLEIVVDGFHKIAVGESSFKKLYLYQVLEQIFEKEILTKDNKIKTSEAGGIYKVEVLKPMKEGYPLIFVSQPFNYCIAPQIVNDYRYLGVEKDEHM